MLDCKILGTVEVSTGGGAVRPSAPKQRALLAALLLNANRVLTMDRLIDAMWESDPPRSAIANVRTYAMSLRRVLTDGEPRLVTSKEGYLLRLSADELDASRFARLAKLGRTAIANGDPRSAVGHLSAALALWRHDHAGVGIARHGAFTHWLTALDEQRREALDDYLDARLALGVDADLIAEIRCSIIEDPLRERRWGQLMLATYRAGDVSGALRCYAQAHEALARGLAVEPGAELRRMHHGILNRDAALQTTEAAPRATPHQLPPAPAVLVGRQDELAAITRAFEDAESPPVAVICGPVGAGTSALAVGAAAALGPKYPDGQLYLDLAEARDPAATLVQELTGPGPHRAARLRSILADRRLLLLLDNVSSAADVRHLLPATPASGVIIAARRPLTTLDTAVTVRVAPLSHNDALGMLAALVGTEEVATCRDDAARVVRACGHLPLAIRIATARLLRRADWNLADLANQLLSGGLDVFEADDLSLRTRLLSAFRALNPLSAATLELFGRLGRADVTAYVAAQALGITPIAAVSALDELTDMHFVTAAHGRYRILPFPAALASELANTSPFDLVSR
ncbi:AfsR/SARP family transcriptional regulator [Actinoplanes sp. NPDC049548]|uniref:AfsR/SARP family transcriptional regulator n=1 Tax=Actinoplanes sp. NPDC049548 TaxID=3155152 RepID=UPI0034227838